MKRVILSVGLLAFLAVVPGAAHAAQLTLQTSATVVTLGSLVAVQIYGNDFPLGADGGDFSLSWDEALDYVGIEIANPPWDVSAWDDSTAGDLYLSYVDVFSTTDTPGYGGTPFLIATLTLVGVEEGSAGVYIAPAQVGWSLAGETIATGYGPPVGVEVTPETPEPSALALLGLAGGSLLWSRRARRHEKIIAR